MAEVDRRGFFRILRRTDPTADDKSEAQPEAVETDPQVRELVDLTQRLLTDVDAGDEERLAEGKLLTTPFDLAYMRVTPNHIVFAIVTVSSAMVLMACVHVVE